VCIVHLCQSGGQFCSEARRERLWNC
jgi:hypothetical protein